MTKALTLEFSFTLDHHYGNPRPRVAIWLDLDADNHRDAGETVPLIKVEDALKWTGSFRVDHALTVPVIVKWLASPGARWTLNVKSTGVSVDRSGDVVSQFGGVIIPLPLPQR